MLRGPYKASPKAADAFGNRVCPTCGVLLVRDPDRPRRWPVYCSPQCDPNPNATGKVRVCKCGTTLPKGKRLCGPSCWVQPRPTPPNPMVVKQCRLCTTAFLAPERNHQVFCSARCRKRTHSSHVDRRARQRRAAVIEHIVPLVVFEREGWICHLCGEAIDPALTGNHDYAASLDHVVPIRLGGHHSYDNVKAAHRICNSREGGRLSRSIVRQRRAA